MNGYVHPSQYQPSPRTTDLAELLREEQIRVRMLKEIVAEQDAEIAARENVINELYAERASEG